MAILTLSDFIIRPYDPLRVALQRMTQNREGILFVCDEDLHLVGVLSDGDVRRTLLDDTLLVAAVSKAMNTDPITVSAPEDAGALLRRFGLVAVPVVGNDGRVTAAVMEIGGELKVIHSAESPETGTDAAKHEGALAIITARGGSKRIPRKNLAMAGGKSLLAWAILAAQKSQRVGRIVVSTDDAEIADAARACGAEVPWLRPDSLSRDDTPSTDVVIHALEWANQALTPPPEFAVLLEPTAPLRTPQHVDAALSLLAGGDADSVISVSEVPHVFNPEELVIIDGQWLRPYIPERTMNTVRPRQQQSPAYVRNGLVYALRTAAVLRHKSLYGSNTAALVIGWEYFLDIDTQRDLQMADFLLRVVHKTS